MVTLSSLSVQLTLTSSIVFLATFHIATWCKKRINPANKPPVVAIPEHEIFSKPREVYERALAEHGPVIAVRRKGRLEYIVDRSLTHEVLTVNSLFSFEDGTSFILNLHYFRKLFATFFTAIDDLVKNVIVTRMPLVVEQVFPVFLKRANYLRDELSQVDDRKQGKRYVHALDHAHKSISEAMTLLILGPEFITPDNLHIIEKIAHDLAVVTGLYQNTSWWGAKFPNAWRVITWIRVLCTTVPLYYRTIGLQIWRKLRSRGQVFHSDETVESAEYYEGSVLDYLAFKSASHGNAVFTFSAYLRITVLVLGIIFASVHQTASVAVWVLYELAVRPEYLPSLRRELFEVTDVDWSEEDVHLSYEHLQKAVRLDSFIREVLRTKGDTISTCRLTTTDVPLAGYVIPKGHLVVPLASLSHMSTQYHGPDAENFDGERWISTGKQAVTVNQTYFPFGLGRWACPGRALAIAEIKMIVWAIICRSVPVLKGGTYSVPDPLNVTSVAPMGEMTLVQF